MLDINHTQFTEQSITINTSDGEAVSYRRNFIGRLEMRSVVTVDERSPVPKAIIHDNIRRAIWYKVYGDLISPLAELQSLALTAAGPVRASRIIELCEHINTLMLLKSPEQKS